LLCSKNKKTSDLSEVFINRLTAGRFIVFPAENLLEITGYNDDGDDLSESYS